jgi:hypothetical protein
MSAAQQTPVSPTIAAQHSLREATGSVDLTALQFAIEDNLERIEQVLGPHYELTLIAVYHGPRPLKDADILLTRNSLKSMLTVIDRFFPPNVAGEPQPRKPRT